MGSSLAGYPDNFDPDQDLSHNGPLKMSSELERVIRMVRLVRLVKLYKYYAVFEERIVREEEEHDGGSGSKIGGAMGDVLSRRVIVLILTMLIVIPLLLAQEIDQESTYLAQSLHAFTVYNATQQSANSAAGLEYQKSMLMMQSDLIYASTNGVEWFADRSRLD